MLSDTDIATFVRDGFVRVDGAFSRAIADQCRSILRGRTGCDPADPTTWTWPVIRLGASTREPFVAAANSARLHAAFDRIVGAGRWLPLARPETFLY